MKPSPVLIGCLGVIGIVAVLMFFGSLNQTSVGNRSSAPERPATRSSFPPLTVYEVTGNRRQMVVSLTYENQSGGTEQRTVPLPWRLEMRRGSGSFLYLAAQKQDLGGTIKATISVDGLTLQAAEADSAYGIASVSGQVP